MRIDESAQRLFALERELAKTEELEVTSSPLRAAAFHIGSHCKDKNDRFMACKEYNKDPAACFQEGKEVTACTAEL